MIPSASNTEMQSALFLLHEGRAGIIPHTQYPITESGQLYGILSKD